MSVGLDAKSGVVLPASDVARAESCIQIMKYLFVQRNITLLLMKKYKCLKSMLRHIFCLSSNTHLIRQAVRISKRVFVSTQLSGVPLNPDKLRHDLIKCIKWLSWLLTLSSGLTYSFTIKMTNVINSLWSPHFCSLFKREREKKKSTHLCDKKTDN